MEIHVYPPRRLWPGCVTPAASHAVMTEKNITECVAGRLATMIGALEAFYQVEARLWAIPDKAEVLPGISCAVTRRPCDKVTVVLPSDASPAEAGALVAAARAIGVPRINVSVEGGVEALCAETRHVLSIQLPAESLAAEERDCGRRIALGDMYVSSGTNDYVVPRRRGIVIVADVQSDAASVAADVNEVLASGAPLSVLTDSVALASELPSLLSGDDEGLLSIVLLHDSDEIVAALDAAEPQLVIAANEDCRHLAARLTADTTVILGPVPHSADVATLLTFAAPVIPVHVFTRSQAVIDPLTAC